MQIVVCVEGEYMAGVACRGLWCVCGWKDVGMVICKSIVVSFLSCLVTFWDSISLSFKKMYFV